MNGQQKNLYKCICDSIFQDRKKCKNLYRKDSKNSTDDSRKCTFTKDNRTEVDKREKTFRMLSSGCIDHARKVKDLSNNNGFVVAPFQRISSNFVHSPTFHENFHNESYIAQQDSCLNGQPLPKIKQQKHLICKSCQHSKVQNKDELRKTKNISTIVPNTLPPLTESVMLNAKTSEKDPLSHTNDKLNLPPINHNESIPNINDRLDCLKKENEELLSRFENMIDSSSKNKSPTPSIDNEASLSHDKTITSPFPEVKNDKTDYSENKRLSKLHKSNDMSMRSSGSSIGAKQRRNSDDSKEDGIREDKKRLPKAVSSMIENKKSDEPKCHCAPRFRVGLGAYNDDQEFRKDFVQKKKMKRRKKFATTIKRMMMKKKRMDRMALFKTERDSSSIASSGLQSVAAKSLSSRAPSRATSIAERNVFAGLVGDLLDKQYQPDPSSNTLQRRDAFSNSPNKISFCRTLRWCDAHGKYPNYIIEGYRRAAETIRFSVPCDVTSLHHVTPLQYLSRHTRVDADLHKYFRAGFHTFRRAVTGSDARQNSNLIDKSQLLEQSQSFLADGMFTALNKMFYGQLGRGNYHRMLSIVLPGGDIDRLSLDDFVGICALAERCFWRAYEDCDKANEQFGCRTHLEYLDFELLEKRMAELDLSLRLKIVLNSLA